jgi:hypothetical protein
MPREYVEALKNGNRTNRWGEVLYELYQQTDQAPPIAIAQETIALAK